MVIELDGKVHNTPNQQIRDNKRTEYLENLGFKVIRFENKMIFENLASVFKEIEVNFKT